MALKTDNLKVAGSSPAFGYFLYVYFLNPKPLVCDAGQWRLKPLLCGLGYRAEGCGFGREQNLEVLSDSYRDLTTYSESSL